MKKNSALYGYLESIGVLQSGSPAEIEQAKHQYWSIVRKEWRRNQRKECKSVTILLRLKQYSKLKNEAIRNKISVTRYIKEAALSQVGRSSCINKELLGEIRQVFFDHYSAIDQRLANKSIDRGEVMNSLQELEKKVFELIR